MASLTDFVSTVLRPVYGLLVMGVFLGIALWAYWPKNKSRFEADGLIPFKENDEER